MINLMSYASAEVSQISGRNAKSYVWYSLRIQRATLVDSSPPGRKRLRAREFYRHSTMARNTWRRLTVWAVVPYLRHESSTWDQRQPLGVALVCVTLDHARNSLKVSPSNRFDSTSTSLRSTPWYSGNTDGWKNSIEYLKNKSEGLYYLCCSPSLLFLLHILPGKVINTDGIEHIVMETELSDVLHLSLLLRTYNFQDS